MVNQLHQLPNDEQLNIAAFSRLFNKTTNSYKYLFFLSLLDILARGNFSNSNPIEFRELMVEMLANAWYPHNLFKISLGTQDKIADKLDSLNLDFYQFKDQDRQTLRNKLDALDLDDILTDIMRYVPFRLNRPFFKRKTTGMKDYDVNPTITNLSNTFFNEIKPIYCFNNSNYQNCTAIILHPEWVEYLKLNYTIIRGWVSWEWLNYLQRRNPNTPALVNKLFPPQKRESLCQQNKYWKVILENTKIRCIYSKMIVLPQDFSLDHYLPWSFIAHDQLWNLIPTNKSVNSSKSNNIPADQYFEEFVKLQHLGLTISHQQTTKKSWLRKIESYIADLKVDNADDLLDLKIITKAYENTIFPLISLANTQGFSSNWVYQNTEEK